MTDKAVIEPAQALAFSMQSAPGVYAVLLGSGVSKAAGIPTGWEITLDLIRKLAGALGESPEPSAERWYADKYGVEPDYSEIVKELAKTPADRQQLLKSYVEPDDQERQEGKKAPTLAHRAIAALARGGFVRVIVTTNFDRLMETALAEEGLVPSVLASADQIQGAPPLTHAECTVLKVHGDYLDTRIRNTEAELETYPLEVDGYLDRVFDEFGLVVCGWSAEWDGALRSAIDRATSRRFATYWAARGDLSDVARGLIQRRSAELVEIEGADEFFDALRQQVEAIEEFSMPHPLSSAVAVASLKRFLPELRHRVRLTDLVNRTVDRVFDETGDHSKFSPNVGPVTDESVAARLQRYDAVCETLVAMASVGGYWAEEEHYAVWRRALRKLGSALPQSGNVVWLALSGYPAARLLYALGIGAVSSGRLQFLGHLLNTPMQARSVNLDSVAGCELAASFVGREWRVRGRALPLNARMFETLWPHAQEVVSGESEYGAVFDRFEVLLALHCSHRKREASERGLFVMVPPGLFVFRSGNSRQWLDEIRGSLSERRGESPFVTAKLFGGTVEECEAALTVLDEAAETWGYGWRAYG